MKIINLSLITSVLVTSLVADEIKILNNLKSSGDARVIYDSVSNDNADNTYSTAMGIGVDLKTENSSGLNVGFAFRATKDIDALSGDGSSFSSDLSSSNIEYETLSKAYIDYKYKNINFRAGRQTLDTPLADSDDIRMVPNSFEAYTATIDLDSVNLIAGFITKWQGYDAGLDNSWIETGDTTVVALTYANKNIESSLWFYNIANGQNASQSIYADLSFLTNLTRDIELTTAIQYLKQNELKNSAIQADIYGAMAEVSAYNITASLAYNASLKNSSKHSLSGFGGGTLFTSMDTMILNEITQDRDSSAIVSTISYDLNSLFNFTYAYGDFNADADSSGVKEHIVEQDVIIEHTPKDNLTLNFIYVIDDNKEHSKSQDFNTQNFRFSVIYEF